MKFEGLIILGFIVCTSSLYPRESSSREVKDIDGLWHFRADFSDNRNAGFEEKWYQTPLAKSGDTILMPVPSSFNDITQNSSLRDFVGWVWYDRQVWIPDSWTKGTKNIKLRFGSVHYNTIVWVNGLKVMEHSGGHLPFEGDITSLVHSDKPITITVAANNTLSPTTIPPGTLNFHDGVVTQNVQMDFFNYAGIHRPVKLYAVPADIYLDEIFVMTSFDVDKNTAQLTFDLLVQSPGIKQGSYYNISVMSRGGTVAANYSGELLPSGNSDPVTVKGQFDIPSPNLWWPWTMSDDPGYLYVFQVTLASSSGVSDVYRHPLGIRTVAISSMNQFLINGKPFYFQGFGKHEDSDIRGKGFDYALTMKDVNLLMWLGANSFRTSHYPYAEELMDLCDKYGIVVVDETPAVGLVKPENFGPDTMKQHVQVLTELVIRDRNRPSVVMWSLANEPDSSLPEAETYFKSLSAIARTMDSRPITFAISRPYNEDKAGQFMDVLCINRYYGWYWSPGSLDAIHEDLPADLDAWYSLHSKPMMITEYGAGAIIGTHDDPPTMYTEDYQSALLAEHFKVFDIYKKKFLVGEMIWNFADFNTAQSSGRAHGNRKGVLTRQRQPKQAAHLVRDRYQSLAHGLNYCSKYCHLTKKL